MSATPNDVGTIHIKIKPGEVIKVEVNGELVEIRVRGKSYAHLSIAAAKKHRVKLHDG